MSVIYKYSLDFIGPYQTITVSMNPGWIVHVAIQEGEVASRLCAWAEVDAEKEKKDRFFVVYPTGVEIPVKNNYVATFFDGPFVWHLYEIHDSKGST